MASKMEEPTTSVSQEHAAAIGRVAIAWASFELVLNLHISLMTRANIDSSACVTAQMVSAHSRITALTALLDLFGASAEAKKKMSKFAQSTYALAEKRNRVIHDPWLAGESGIHYRLQITAKQQFVFKHIPEDMKTVTAIEKEILNHRNRFQSLWQELMSEPNLRTSWLEKFPPLGVPERGEPVTPDR